MRDRLVKDSFKFLQVKIFFWSMDVTQIVEEAKMNGQTTMNSLGGALSLFLGISFVAVIEFIELTARILACIFSPGKAF